LGGPASPARASALRLCARAAPLPVSRALLPSPAPPPPPPPQIANAIKAKGLQKLRWYCQLCQKQCRDENGFKCHQSSDSHMRQMELFGMNPQGMVEQFSREFEEDFLEHLRKGCGARARLAWAG
jgi:hypothetical protein